MKETGGDGQDVMTFCFLAVVAIFIGIIVTWSAETKDVKCDDTCGDEGLRPIYVSKASMCLCYDEEGILRVPKVVTGAKEE